MKDARNPHYGTCSSIQFQDGPETYSILISSGALNINQEEGTTRAQEQRSKEHSKKE